MTDTVTHDRAVQEAMREWTQEDTAAALHEGWMLFDTGEALRVQRDDEAAILTSDFDAMLLIRGLGSALHDKVRRVIATYRTLTEG